MEDKIVAVIGAGGHGRSVVALLENAGYQIGGVYDDSFKPEIEELIGNAKLVGAVEDAAEEKKIVLAVGNNLFRSGLFSRFSDQILTKNTIHSTAYLEPRAILGEGNLVFARAYFNSEVSVGSNNIFNSGCILEHEVKVGNHCHISVNSTLCGRVKVGDYCFMGAGSVIKDGVTVGEGVTIGAGGVVINDIEEPGSYVGNPVRKIK